VIVVGSQSILGTFREDQLPADATRSVEIDILPIADDNSDTEKDRNFVAALVRSALVDRDTIHSGGSPPWTSATA
jgi:hypothetical protein